MTLTTWNLLAALANSDADVLCLQEVPPARLDAVLRLAPGVVAGDFNALPDWPERRFARDAGYVDIGPAAPTCNVNAGLQPLDTVLVRASRWWPPSATTARPIAPGGARQMFVVIRT